MTAPLHVLSLSGGKDSAACALFLRERGIEHVRVFMDTGWEHPDLYAHLDYLEEKLGPIIRLRSTVDIPAEYEDSVRNFEARLGVEYSPMVRWCVRKAMFPSRMVRWCTQELKVKPFLAWANAQNDDIVNIVGIRAEESTARADLPEMDSMPGADHIQVWRPLIKWTEHDVINIHTRHGVRPCPLYLRGAGRVGCWPCVMASKAELRMLAEDDARVGVMRDLERFVSELVAQRRPDSRHSPGWYQARMPEADGTYPCWPIDRVLEWSRTTHGGRQFELFGSTSRDAGCTRWGLCEMKV